MTDAIERDLRGIRKTRYFYDVTYVTAST